MNDCVRCPKCEYWTCEVTAKRRACECWKEADRAE